MRFFLHLGSKNWSIMYPTNHNQRLNLLRNYAFDVLWSQMAQKSISEETLKRLIVV